MVGFMVRVRVGIGAWLGCSLVVRVLWHIKLCRLFNVKFIFMKIVLFQTIQFSISMQFSSI